jgi:hypothetical protein
VALIRFSLVAVLFVCMLAAPLGAEPRAERTDERPQEGVQWKSLLWQSGIFLGVQHGFRFATEPGTRQELPGKFVKDYVDSVSSIHGWADGDPFYVNYVGHPMQGAVAGYIWVSNDTKYRTAQFGRNSHYWKSRLRATAFSTAYSLQFEIGPLSEASLGNIQKYPPQFGVVDIVVTPTVGLGWQVAEDALDRKVIQPLERAIHLGPLDGPVKMILRGALNPARSFSNAMRLKVPWHRDDRPGVY